MANKNVQIKDLQGNNLFPKTKGAIVTNNVGATLGDVEAGAQVNKIEVIQVNGVTQGISGKTVNLKVEGAAYSMIKQQTPESGASATYSLTKDGTPVGEKINILKDMVIESGDVKTCVSPNVPVAGYQVGDKYLDLVLANSTDKHIYILVSDLVDKYKAGNGISITGNTISANTDQLSSTFATNNSVDAKLKGKADTATTLAGYGIKDAYTQSEINEKVNAKADKSTTLAGYGITDAYTQTQVDGKLSKFITYEEIV